MVSFSISYTIPSTQTFSDAKQSALHKRRCGAPHPIIQRLYKRGKSLYIYSAQIVHNRISIFPFYTLRLGYIRPNYAFILN